MKASRFANAHKRARSLITPEGLSLPLTVASRGARVKALLIDLCILLFTVVAFAVFHRISGLSLQTSNQVPAALKELIEVIGIIFLFVLHHGYFLAFELGPRGATPGKRLIGIRVAARGGGALKADMLLARNLIRDIEILLPAVMLLDLAFSDMPEYNISGWALAAWLLVFVLLPFTNKDALRAGDLIAGTWVVESSKVKLPDALSLTSDNSPAYRFGPQELAIYGEHELQVLETVLRTGNSKALADVARAISRKIGWQVNHGQERAFLEAFYQALRAHLEGGMRFGRRKADKFS